MKFDITMIPEKILSKQELVDYVNENVTYKPGYSLTASVCSCGVEGCDLAYLDVAASVVDSNAWAISGARHHDLVGARYNLLPGTVRDVQDQLLKAVLDLETHEAREFLRFDKFAPYHPHRTDGEWRFTRRRSTT